MSSYGAEVYATHEYVFAEQTCYLFNTFGAETGIFQDN